MSLLRKLLIALVVLVLFVLLTACAAGTAAAAGLQQLPDEGRILVLELITAGVTALLLWLGGVIRIDLRGFIQPIAAALAPLVVTVIERYLSMIPPVFDNFVLVAIHYIVLFLGGLATVIVVRRVRTRSTRALLS